MNYYCTFISHFIIYIYIYYLLCIYVYIYYPIGFIFTYFVICSLYIYIRMSWAGFNWDSTNGLAGSATMVWPGKGILSVSKISHLNPAYSALSCPIVVFSESEPNFSKSFPLFLGFCDSKPQLVQVVPSSFPMFSTPEVSSSLLLRRFKPRPGRHGHGHAAGGAATPEGAHRRRHKARGKKYIEMRPLTAGAWAILQPLLLWDINCMGRNGWDIMGWLARFFCEWVELGVPFCALDFLPCVLCMVWLGLEQTGVSATALRSWGFNPKRWPSRPSWGLTRLSNHQQATMTLRVSCLMFFEDRKPRWWQPANGCR